ncbi:isopentenyl pyrophosphate isomerase [Paenibacillus swuensis]|uniref:Isopentenyl-diphosphate delta-isomerase n=1 Tax=Paenibacillus swuensis TaxID=1178515 RepID=A0A172TJV9_9BACL|nr:type 2 isopentenyl-diphosphate Delta-isomerase [Paenibacillus swuensis]ANE47256.1 isopentenyl pyrophosphate isomerase [Paenibacillus swuensis]
MTYTTPDPAEALRLLGEGTERRKSQHIEICLNEDVQGRNITTGLERYRFVHNPLPELAFSAISTETSFLGRAMRAPLVVSSMTGGTKRAERINRALAEAAQHRGWAMGVGSVRAAVENQQLADTFRVREYAPDIPIFSNVGAVQLNYGFGAEEARRAVDLVHADGLVLHLNSMQEVFQPEGDTDFSGLLRRIDRLCSVLEVPVGVKEVGWGIDGATALKLLGAGVRFIDAAGAGGTSWSQVEKHRSGDPLRQAAAEAFAGWGIPTAESVRAVRAAVPQGTLIASGGLATGVDAAKSIALGADLAGFGRQLLADADGPDATERLVRRFEQTELELRIAMFGIGVSCLKDLRGTERLVAIAER